MTGPVTAYKGFDAHLRCRGCQYEIGKEYDYHYTMSVDRTSPRIGDDPGTFS